MGTARIVFNVLGGILLLFIVLVVAVNLGTRPKLGPDPGAGAGAVAPHPLPFVITDCELKPTGFLGLGKDRQAIVSVLNQGDRQGIFTVRVKGVYPGGGEVEHGTDLLPVPAMDKATSEVRFTPSAGIVNVKCEVDPPLVSP
jgi:hypothetical protein